MKKMEVDLGVLGFHKDVFGNVYFPTRNGNTFLYKQDTSEFEVLPPKAPNNKVYFVEESVQWLSYILDSPDKFKNQKISSRNRMKIAIWEYKPLLLDLLFVDKDGCLWYDAELRETHYLACYDGKELKKLISGITNFSSMDYTKKGFIIGTSSEFVRVPGINPIAQGIYLVDLEKFTYELIEVPKVSLELTSMQARVYKNALNLPDEIPISVYDIFRDDSKDVFYLITNTGLFKFDVTTKELTKFTPDPPDPVASILAFDEKIIASGSKKMMYYDGTKWSSISIRPFEYFDIAPVKNNVVLLSSFTSKFIYELPVDELIDIILSGKNDLF